MSKGLPILPELSGEERRRYSRQIQLVEIGERGQHALCAGVVTLRSKGFARSIEERYVRAAGMQLREQCVSEPETLQREPATDCVEALGLRHAASRDVAAGALDALLSVRAALGVKG